MSIVGLYAADRLGEFSAIRIAGLGFSELAAYHAEAFDDGYLLITAIDPELTDLVDLNRELEAEGYFAELLGRSALLCRGNGVAVFQDLSPSLIEVLHIDGPITAEDFRRLRLRFGYFMQRVDDVERLGGRTYMLWRGEDDGLIYTRSDSFLRDTLLFAFQKGVFGEERFLTAEERKAVVDALLPLVLESGLYIDVRAGAEQGALEALALGWYPDARAADEDSVHQGLRVPAHVIRISGIGEIVVGERKTVNILGQLGLSRFLALEFGPLFPAFVASLLFISTFIVLTRGSLVLMVGFAAQVLLVSILWGRILRETL